MRCFLNGDAIHFPTNVRAKIIATTRAKMRYAYRRNSLFVRLANFEADIHMYSNEVLLSDTMEVPYSLLSVATNVINKIMTSAGEEESLNCTCTCTAFITLFLLVKARPIDLPVSSLLSSNTASPAAADNLKAERLFK